MGGEGGGNACFEGKPKGALGFNLETKCENKGLENGFLVMSR